LAWEQPSSPAHPSLSQTFGRIDYVVLCLIDGCKRETERPCSNPIKRLVP